MTKTTAEDLAGLIMDVDLTTRLQNQNALLRHCLGFFASVIKSGEPWTDVCEKEYRAAMNGSWKCRARPTADPPQDCDWPVCGCDPYADKVIGALEESGALTSTE
jgi:hypothetical protein